MLNDFASKSRYSSKKRALILAAGLGSRLRPITESIPKPLMPIFGRPLLEYWLEILWKNEVRDVVVNYHYMPDLMRSFLSRERFEGWVTGFYEPDLLGTAGTVREVLRRSSDRPLLLLHGDNLCSCDFNDFLTFHDQRRPKLASMSMMTFRTESPKECGIVELDDDGLVIAFHEKVAHPPSSLANAAIYVIDRPVQDWILNNCKGTDFSADVVPNFLGHIATWENRGTLIDIGTIKNLKKALAHKIDEQLWTDVDTWSESFAKHPVHKQISELLSL